MPEPISHRVAMLGTGLIGDLYARTIQGQRGRDRVVVAYSRSSERGKAFCERLGIPRHTTSIDDAVNDPDVDTVVVGLPNDLHLDAVQKAAKAGKSLLITKPLGRDAAEAKAILEVVESAGVFGGYLEDMPYIPKTMVALASIASGVIGDVTWVRARSAHPGPHSAWFWDPQRAGGGVVIDLGCHSIEVTRACVGKGNRPVEVMAWADTLVHPIAAEDNAIVLIRYESGAIGQVEASWTFRGGMDARTEVSGTQGSIKIDYSLRTGIEIFTSGVSREYVAEKAETDSGWLFPVADEIGEFGYGDMFADMFDAIDHGRQPRETLYDGYVVNAIMDAALKSARTKQWEPVELDWRD